MRAALAGSVEQLVSLGSALRSDPTPERVHVARASVRRLRSRLRSFRPLMHPLWSDRLRERLRWLSDVLSSARDADVLVSQITKFRSTKDAGDFEALLEPFRQRRTQAYAVLGEALGSLRYRNLIEGLIAAASAPQFMPAAYHHSARRLAEVMRPTWRRLRKQIRRAGKAPSDRELHRIRIKAKDVRYAAEVLARVLGEPARRFAKRAEDLQTLLGEQHDAVVVYDALHVVLDAPRVAFLAGEISTREADVAENYRRRWRRCWKRLARKTPRFW